MGFLRRGGRPAAAAEWTVGVGNHRVVVGGPQRGIAQLAELHAYVDAVTGGARQPVEGRDPVAVLSAKMDQAELVNDTAGAVSLALGDLVERGLVDPAAVPPQPDLPPVPQRATHYDYIQSAHARAMTRLGWLDACDALLARHDVALLPPRPEDDPARRHTR